MEPRWFLSATMATSPGDFSLDDYIESAGIEQLLSSADIGKLIGLDQVEVQYGFTGSGQTAVLIDTGIAYDHFALSDGYGAGYRVVGGYDFAEDDDDPYDDGPFGSHGTHVAGILSSTDARAAGIAPGADIVALRVFDDRGNGSFHWVEEALQWVHSHRDSFANPITTVNLSIGTAYNGQNGPAWAMLEDEFAELASDGIFISVAAGNAFTTYRTTGLSYPAVSPNVVPVSSVDAAGNLSYFSQRDDRVIAAPGRSILSTVPDYMGNGNGVADDFARYSGTSMAAPVVAGASVLLRQAYEFAGVTNVDQQMLYSTMLATADRVYDAATGAYYHRLNLQRAIDSVMPADDFGSTSQTATRLGTAIDTLSLDGVIGRLDDSDWFSFEAGASGTLTLSLTTSAELSPQWEFASWPSDAVIDGNTVTFTVIAGQTYTVGLSMGQNLAHYSLDVNLEAIVETLSLCSVIQIGREVHVSGTAGDDTFSLTITDAYHRTFIGPMQSALSNRGFSNGPRYFDEVHTKSKSSDYDPAMLYHLFDDMESRTGKRAKMLCGLTTEDHAPQCSAADGTSAQSATVPSIGFQPLQAAAYAGKSIQSRAAVIDFLMAAI